MLPKKQRLKLKKDFNRVFKVGSNLRNNLFSLKFAHNSLVFPRVAIVVQSKNFPKAVARNKIKRTISAILSNLFSGSKKDFKGGVDIIIFVQPGIRDKKFSEIQEILFEIFKKANIV